MEEVWLKNKLTKYLKFEFDDENKTLIIETNRLLIKYENISLYNTRSLSFKKIDTTSSLSYHFSFFDKKENIYKANGYVKNSNSLVSVLDFLENPNEKEIKFDLNEVKRKIKNNEITDYVGFAWIINDKNENDKNKYLVLKVNVIDSDNIDEFVDDCYYIMTNITPLLNKKIRTQLSKVFEYVYTRYINENNIYYKLFLDNNKE